MPEISKDLERYSGLAKTIGVVLAYLEGSECISEIDREYTATLTLINDFQSEVLNSGKSYYLPVIDVLRKRAISSFESLLREAEA